MFLIDNIVTSPLRGVMWLAEKIHTSAMDEQQQDAEAITHQLTELYQLLETGQISETEFDEQEKLLLDRLERYEQRDEQ